METLVRPENFQPQATIPVSLGRCSLFKQLTEKIVVLKKELIPKLTIESLSSQIPMINRVSDHENGSETFIDLEVKLVLG